MASKKVTRKVVIELAASCIGWNIVEGKEHLNLMPQNDVEIYGHGIENIARALPKYYPITITWDEWDEKGDDDGE